MRIFGNILILLKGLTGAVCWALVSTATVLADIPPDTQPEALSVPELREAIRDIQSALDQLPKRLIRETGGTLGHRTLSGRIKDTQLWLEVDLEKTEPFDLIALIPMVLIDEDQNQSDTGFPARYQITIFDDEDSTGRLLFDSADLPGANPPNRAPVLIECPGTSARRIRITDLESTLDPITHSPVFALAELMIFDGQKNRALGKPVTASLPVKTPPLYDPAYATDGYMPFAQLRSKETTKNNLGMVWQNHPPIPARFTLDLGKEYPIDEVRLYPVHLGYNFSVFHRTGLGFPLQFSIEVSNQPDFKTFDTLFQTGDVDYPPPGHRLAMFSGGGLTGRYVRVVAPKLPLEPNKKKPLMALSEIEVISDGVPVSLHANVTTFGGKDNWWKSSPLHLSDGLSSHGKIPLLRDWLVQLSERSQLERRLNALDRELSRKTLQQSKRLHRLSWAISLAIPLLAIVFLWQRLVRLKQITRVREGLAADLHDEIGGNFSGIALLCDQLTGDPGFPRTYSQKLERIANTSRESAQNTRNLVQLLESDQIHGKLIEKMEAVAKLMLAGTTYRFDIQGAKYIEKLPAKDKWHLLLFFKEALTNIVKHAGATEVVLNLHLAPRRLTLSIADNGRGIEHERNGSKIPFHLQARAQKLHGEVTINTSPETGTTIILKKKL
jgi:signal transduction histidine kinase